MFAMPLLCALLIVVADEAPLRWLLLITMITPLPATHADDFRLCRR